MRLVKLNKCWKTLVTVTGNRTRLSYLSSANPKFAILPTGQRELGTVSKTIHEYAFTLKNTNLFFIYYFWDRRLYTKCSVTNDNTCGHKPRLISTSHNGNEVSRSEIAIFQLKCHGSDIRLSAALRLPLPARTVNRLGTYAERKREGAEDYQLTVCYFIFQQKLS